MKDYIHGTIATLIVIAALCGAVWLTVLASESVMMRNEGIRARYEQESSFDRCIDKALRSTASDAAILIETCQGLNEE